jgi:hypothetical protein
MRNSLSELIAHQPRTPIPLSLSNLEPNIVAIIHSLNSQEAFHSIDANPYWPKWDSPWWQMSVLFEMGMADRIPKKTAQHLLAAAKRTQLPYFFSEDAPKDKREDQEAPCPCSLGNIYQILSATGLNVDEALPWARGWFLQYQMTDGGLSCDEGAYKAGPNTSSLVGTISPLEAILSNKELTPEEIQFLDRGAKCLLDRELRLGSSSEYNAEERLDEEDWLKPCFPRLYFYDVLRGLNFVLHWAERLNRTIPSQSIYEVVRHFSQAFPDGRIQAQRHSYEGCKTRLMTSPGTWTRKEATFFPLLNQVSEVGKYSPFLTAQWQKAVATIDRLSQKELIS